MPVHATRVLVVDEEKNERLNFRTTLETEGYEVFEASSAELALDLLAEHSFALAILDLRMPGIGGLELLARMRASEINVPAMIVTAYSDVPHAVKAMKLGAIDFDHCAAISRVERFSTTSESHRECVGIPRVPLDSVRHSSRQPRLAVCHQAVQPVRLCTSVFSSIRWSPSQGVRCRANSSHSRTDGRAGLSR